MSRAMPTKLNPLKNRHDSPEIEFWFIHQVAKSLGNAIDAKDGQTSLRSRQVAGLARSLALRLGLEARQVEAIHIAGHLQDVGKIGIPDAILQKRQPLTDAEWALIRAHPVIGARIIAPVQAFNGSTGIAKMVLHHHERWDGRGYPDGLRDVDIPLGARILALADGFSAMLEPRAYRPRLSLDQALDEIRRGAGTQFDPQLSDMLATMVLEAEVAEAHFSVDLLVTRTLCAKVLRKYGLEREEGAGMPSESQTGYGLAGHF